MSRTHATKGFWLAALRADGAALLGTVSQPGALDMPVPSCPGWGVGDLLRHLGAGYRRTALHAGSAQPDHIWGPVIIPDDAPAPDRGEVVAWFGTELTRLDAFLEALDPDLPAWNWAPQARTASFWHRRMAHETAVHRWDAQLATGLPEPLESKLAGDTVAEALDTFLPAGRRRSKVELFGVVQLVAADLGMEFFVRLRGDGVALLDTGTLLDDDPHVARATAVGTASDLGLALWGRIAVDNLETAGDTHLLDALRVS